MLILFLLLLVLLCAVGIGLGFLLHWIIPVIDLGMGVLTGVVATAWAIHFCTRLLHTLEVTAVEEAAAAEFETLLSKPIRPGARQRRKKS